MRTRTGLYRRGAGVRLTVVATMSLVLGASVLTGTAEAATTSQALGVPRQIGISVPDLDTTSAQLAAGTGTRFADVTSTTVSVRLPGEPSSREVRLRRTRSLGEGPALVLEQASPAIGPWAASGGTYLSYPVPDVDSAGQKLRDAGFELAATSDDFTFWRGVGGVLVRLIDERAVPGSSEAAGQSGDNLGPVRSVTFAPCNSPALKDQFTKALGVSWKTRMLVPLPWQYADGRIEPKVHQVDASQERAPHLTIETPDPAQTCTPEHTPVHLVFFTADVAAAERRLSEAGMTFVGRAAVLATYFRGAGGFYLEIGNTAFQLAELLP